MASKRILIITLIVSMMLVGTGYAFWSDQITITGTVTTGSLDIDWVKTSVSAVGAVAEVINDDDDLKITISDFYPGAKAGVNVTAINNGSIPAKLKDVKISFDTKNDLPVNLIQVRGWYEYPGTTGTADSQLHGSGTTLHLEGLDDAIKSKWANVVLQPEQTISFCPGVDEKGLMFYFDPLAGNEYQGKTLKFTLDLTWGQVNSSSDPGNGGSDPGGGTDPGSGGDSQVPVPHQLVLVERTGNHYAVAFTLAVDGYQQRYVMNVDPVVLGTEHTYSVEGTTYTVSFTRTEIENWPPQQNKVRYEITSVVPPKENGDHVVTINLWVNDVPMGTHKLENVKFTGTETAVTKTVNGVTFFIYRVDLVNWVARNPGP